MRIGLVTPSWPGGRSANGITTAVSHLAGGLRQIGHHVTIIPLEEADEADPTVLNLPAPRQWTLLEKLSMRSGRDVASIPILSERLTQAILKAIRIRGIEVVIMEETNGFAGIVQKNVEIPVIVSLHGPHAILAPINFNVTEPKIRDERLRVKREAAAFLGCAGVTAPSKDVLDRMIALYGLPDCPLSVIPNSMPAPPPLTAQAIRSQIRKLLFIGRYDLIKGGDTVIKAFERIAQEEPEAQLTFIGPDSGVALPDGTMQYIDATLATLPAGIRARIHYRGQLDKAACEALRYSHGVAVVASRYETFGYTALEAIAFGMPTVVTAAGALSDVVRDKETAILVPADDPDSMAYACIQLIQEPDLAIGLASKAHVDASTRFSPAKIAKDIEGFILSVQEQF